MSEVDIESLKAPLKPYLGDWRSIDLRIIALRPAKEGNWVFNSIRALLDTCEPTEPVRTDLPQIEDILALHKRWDISRLDQVLAAIHQGEIEVDGRKITIKSFNGSQWTSFGPQRFTLLKRGGSMSRYNVETTCYVMEIQSSMTGLIDRAREDSLDSTLRATNPPWDGVNDLRTNFAMMGEWGRVSFSFSRMDIVAPLNVRLGGSKLEGDRIGVPIIRSRLTNTAELSVSIIATRGTETMGRHHQRVSESTKSTDSNRIEETFELKANPTRVRVFLGYRGIEVDSEEIFALGPQSEARARILEVEGFAGLQTLLSGNGDLLERGVAVLFHALGFNAANYGKGFQDSADVIALEHNRGPALVIECTGGVLNQRGKLSKLVMRTRELEEKVPGVEFRPVVVTSQKRDSLSVSDKEAAKSDRIIVITADDIPTLLQMISEGTSVEGVMSYLERLLGSQFG